MEGLAFNRDAYTVVKPVHLRLRNPVARVRATQRRSQAGRKKRRRVTAPVLLPINLTEQRGPDGDTDLLLTLGRLFQIIRPSHREYQTLDSAL